MLSWSRFTATMAGSLGVDRVVLVFHVVDMSGVLKGSNQKGNEVRKRFLFLT